LGWPTRSRALALTALAAENGVGLRFAMAGIVWNRFRSRESAAAESGVR
jgi:hypothetical protein